MSDDIGVDVDYSKLENLINQLNSNYYVDIGILGNDYNDEGIAIAGIGAVHEFGSEDGRITKRSFIRMPLEKKQDEIQKSVESRLEEMLANGDIEGIFELIGIAGVNAILEAFETGGFGTWEDIKEKTKLDKGSSAILIDQGDLMKFITSKVGGKK